jgi:hypothetical protein
VFAARRAFTLAALIVAALPAIVGAQAAKKPKTGSSTAALPSPLYASETPLAITFTTNIRQLRGDKADKSPWRAATVSFADPAGKVVSLPARTKTHGVWRLKNCDLPPLRLDVVGDAKKGTPFQNIGHPKVVNVCRNSDRYDQLVLSELQLYRAYRLLTPISHQVRLLRTSYVDSASGQPHATRYSFLIEDPDRMAARLGGKVLDLKGARPNDLDAPSTAVALLFEYFIANTDFSVPHLHNIELVGLPDGSYVTVAYDFDFSGAVNAPYATADRQFNITSVRQRAFRGYCAHRETFAEAAALFRAKKDAIYALYRDDIGKLMDRDVVDATLRYFDEFYEAIATPRRAEELFASCVGPS